MNYTDRSGWSPARRGRAARFVRLLQSGPKTALELQAALGVKHDLFRVTLDDARSLLRDAGHHMIPRPVAADEYQYRLTNKWDELDEDPNIQHGALFRIRDELTRDRVTLEHYETAVRPLDGRSRLARQLWRVIDGQREIIRRKEQLLDLIGGDGQAA